jgi:hypothetical protein
MTINQHHILELAQNENARAQNLYSLPPKEMNKRYSSEEKLSETVNEKAAKEAVESPEP